jgi:prepilin-type N-terminal cleavage/methylation domain-containing protein
MRLTNRHGRGFTLIEMMVTIGIAALLGLMVVPNLVSMVDAGRTSVMVNKFPQDVAWARNQAVTTQQPVQIDLSGLAANNCTWTTQTGAYQADGTIAWATSAEHSLTAAQQQASYPNATCQEKGGTANTLVFDSQGLISNGNAPTITVNDAHGQAWTLQVLTSGTVLQNAKTAS